MVGKSKCQIRSMNLKDMKSKKYTLYPCQGGWKRPNNTPSLHQTCFSNFVSKKKKSLIYIYTLNTYKNLYFSTNVSLISGSKRKTLRDLEHNYITIVNY